MKHLHAYLMLCAALCACSDEPSTGGEQEGNGPDPVVDNSVTVIDFRPAPGQFINEMPEYETGDTYADMLAKVQKSLDNHELVSLGAWGGSITLKLNTPLVISYTKPNFRVLGNSYTTGNKGDLWWGSSEPGYIEVMEDTNGNGKPDDFWYKISTGLESVEETVTYTLNDDGSVTYVTSDGTEGEIIRNAAYHTQPFWPQWLTDKTMTISGLRLPDNGVFDQTTQKYIQYCYPNCADSYPNNSSLSIIDINIPLNPIKKINFIRITTAVLQCNGPMGECSTEICGIERLH